MKFILEPMALALDENASEKEFLLYVNRLLQWENWMQKFPDDVFMLSDTCSVLSQVGCFPIYDVFSKLLDKYKVNYVLAKDLNMYINKLVSGARKLDRSLEGAYEFEPVRLVGYRRRVCEDVVWQAFERTLDYIYCLCMESGLKQESFVLFGKDLPGEVCFQVEFDGLDKQMKSVKGKAEAKVMCCSSLKEFFCNNDTSALILRNHREKEDVDLAARVAVYQRGDRKKVMDVFSNYQFYIQDSFYQDFCVAHYESQPNFLSSFTNAIGNCLTGTQIRDREAYRTGRGGNNPQMKHDGYWAWRWFVTKSVKMQYWQRGQDYRFANIKEHDIFECQWEEKRSVR